MCWEAFDETAVARSGCAGAGGTWRCSFKLLVPLLNHPLEIFPNRREDVIDSMRVTPARFGWELTLKSAPGLRVCEVARRRCKDIPQRERLVTRFHTNNQDDCT